MPNPALAYTSTIHTIAALILLGISTSAVAPAQAQTAPPQPALTFTGDLVPLDRPAQPTPATPPAGLTFAFSNALEYGDCLETILQLYERPDNLSDRVKQDSCYATIQEAHGDGGLTRQQALSLVSSADFYATHFLSRQLFPLRGQRIRIAEQFGFIYAVDSNDDAMKQRAASASTAGAE